MSYLLNSAYDSALSAVRRGVIKILASGPIPQHIGFVMDGNRRYARRRNMPIKDGHATGFNALQRMLEICLRLGVKCVTVFAFSIENFKRNKDEVDALMELAENKLLEIAQQGYFQPTLGFLISDVYNFREVLDRYGVRLNVLGKIEMLPEAVQRSVRTAQDMTKNNTRSILNLCMPYTSRDEITTAVQSAIQEKLVSGLDVAENPITEDDIERYMMTTLGGSPPLDILIRSSGVKRLSDFLMWQASENAQLHFVPTYWPDIGIWDLFPIILDYQTKVWNQHGEGWRSDQWASFGIECVGLIATVMSFDLAHATANLAAASVFSISQAL